MVKLTMNGGKKKHGRPVKTQSKPKPKKDKRTKKKPKKTTKCDRKMSEIVDKVIDDVASIKRKNDNDEIEDLLLNSIDDLHKVFRLFKRIEDPSYLLPREEFDDSDLDEDDSDLDEDEDDLDDDLDGDLDGDLRVSNLESPVIELPTEEPIDEEPVDEEPVDEEPVDEEPVDEEPVDEEPVDEEPMDEEPMDEEPMDEEPVDEVWGKDEELTDVTDPLDENVEAEIEEIKKIPQVAGGSRKKLKNILDELNNNK
jgi:hypothetical protein